MNGEIKNLDNQFLESVSGILLCKDKKESLVEMTLPKDNKQIFASKYQTVLPSKEELKKLLG